MYKKASKEYKNGYDWVATVTHFDSCNRHGFDIVVKWCKYKLFWKTKITKYIGILTLHLSKNIEFIGKNETIKSWA